jgi:hypothetical protein
MNKIIGTNDFDDFLDENYDKIKILEITFFPSVILRKCDPIAHRIYSQDFIDALEEEEEDKE